MLGTEPLSGFDETIVKQTFTPIELVDGPRWHVWFLEILDSGVRLSQLFGERVPCRRELAERKLIEPIDFLGGVSHGR